jgi:8-oxo-dGTP diphosphatase
MHTDTRTYPALTVAIVAFALQDRRLQVLLAPHGEAPFEGCWALPGGFLKLDESLDAAAQRVLSDEAGISGAYLEQLYTFGDPQRDPRGRVVTAAYLALVRADAALQAAGAAAEADRARWRPTGALPELAFDHAVIIDYALQRLRNKLEYSAAGFALLPAEFTLPEIQETYELVLGEKLDKRNFRRRILESGVIEATPNMRSSEGRPARLYRYRPDAVAEVRARRLFP